MCGGFLGFERIVIPDRRKQERPQRRHEEPITHLPRQWASEQKPCVAGGVTYNTRYTMWGGTQPARLEMESGLDRRLFIIDIEMSPEKEAAYKIAQHKQSNMTREQRAELAGESIAIRNWINTRMLDAMFDPPSGVVFAEIVSVIG